MGTKQEEWPELLFQEAPCEHMPDDLPDAGDRCKHCEKAITWTGPGMYDWELCS